MVGNVFIANLAVFSLNFQNQIILFWLARSQEDFLLLTLKNLTLSATTQKMNLGEKYCLYLEKLN
jgi:hypothetical protein